MSTIERIQAWYSKQCDGKWEHSWGVHITTLDNPGWGVSIDLVGTALQDVPFAEVFRGMSEGETDWVHCCVKASKFEGHGGARNLEEILNAFLSWAET